MFKNKKRNEKTMSHAHVITKTAIRRLIRAAGGRRMRAALDLYSDTPGTDDVNGIVHEIFTSFLDDLVEKVVSLMKLQRSKTMLPRHVREIAAILGDEDEDDSNLPGVSFAPIERHIRLTSGAPPGTRFSKEAMKLLLLVALSKTILHLRSAAGLVSHHGQKTMRTRDVYNVSAICQDFPQKR